MLGLGLKLGLRLRLGLKLGLRLRLGLKLGLRLRLGLKLGLRLKLKIKVMVWIRVLAPTSFAFGGLSRLRRSRSRFALVRGSMIGQFSDSTFALCAKVSPRESRLSL